MAERGPDAPQLEDGPRPMSLAWVLVPLAGMIVTTAWLSLASVGPLPQTGGIAPSLAWLSLPQGSVIERIAFGSGLDQTKPEPILASVVNARPQLMLMLGDNVYGDDDSSGMGKLRQAYAAQTLQPELAVLRASVPVLATWDDHDFGRSQGGADFMGKDRAAALFNEFWQLRPDASTSGAVYRARVYGPPGRRVQVILLDTRYFRSRWRVKQPGFPYAGPYGPDDAPEKTMLGERQWQWLENQLLQPAELRLVVSSIQVLAEGHGWERWGNLPRERERLIGLIERTGARGVVLLSGNRSAGAFYRTRLTDGTVLVEVTSSALNRPLAAVDDARIAPLASDIYPEVNYGLAEIDWGEHRLRLSLRGLDGGMLEDVRLSFADLAIAP